MPGLTGDTAERVIGAFYLVLAVILTLPIPLGNVLPALAISIIALGMIERDGVWVLAGFAVGVAAMIVVGGVLSTLVARPQNPASNSRGHSHRCAVFYIRPLSVYFVRFYCEIPRYNRV